LRPAPKPAWLTPISDHADKKITEKDIVGLKYFEKLGEMLQQLHNVGCERDRAGNRSLHMDHYCMLILLYMFNPVVTSLRGLQQASELQKVQKKLGCPRTSLGSLSESVAVFDAERLKPIIEMLGQKLESIAADDRLNQLRHTLTIVDGTIVEALPRIALAAFRSAQSGSGNTLKWTLHTHFEVARSVPETINMTPTAEGEHAERAVMERVIEAKPHKSKGRYGGSSACPDCDGFLRSETRLLDAPAEIIACMLISLWTGCKPTLRTHEMICWSFCGMASEAELLAHLAQLKKPPEAGKPLI
jgi:hypothetical protein